MLNFPSLLKELREKWDKKLNVNVAKNDKK
jgi:hypothetical protein